MSLSPQKMREVVFQLLFSLDNGAINTEEVVLLISKELALSKKYVYQALDKVKKIQDCQSALDREIGEISKSYTFERIQNVEKNILRLGAYELINDSSIPPKVAIAEAMRIARKFSTPESAAFVNAVLDAIYKKSQGDPIDDASVRESISVLLESQARAEEASKLPPSEQKDEDEAES